jgi:hypothetical protein
VRIAFSLWAAVVLDLEDSELALGRVGERIAPSVRLSDREALNTAHLLNEQRLTHLLKAFRPEVFKDVVHPTRMNEA